LTFAALARHSSESWNPAFFMKNPVVYILSSGWRGTLYVGVTSDIIKRTYEHKTHVVHGFTKKYRVQDLVWIEQHLSMEAAIAREKAIKAWKRDWKIALIEESNPQWRDVYQSLL
jgi:putative endonuclease